MNKPTHTNHSRQRPRIFDNPSSLRGNMRKDRLKRNFLEREMFRENIWEMEIFSEYVFSIVGLAQQFRAGGFERSLDRDGFGAVYVTTQNFDELVISLDTRKI